MRVYLLRHGIAETARPGAPDRNRALTPEGQRKLRDIFKIAKRGGLTPDLILSSPYRRAIETAEIVALTLACPEPWTPCEALVPAGDPDAVWVELRAYQDLNAIVLVSHEPLISQLFNYLLGGPALLVSFRQGTLACVEIEAFGARPRGTLRYLLAPELAGE